MSDQPLRVAIIGLGVGEQHARAFASLPCSTLSCVYDIDAQRSAALGKTLGVPVASSEADIYSDPSIDVVSIASYDADHAGQVVAALRSGKHVFVEKPMCRTAPELRAIRAAWQASGGERHVTSNLVLRGAPLYQWLRRAIDDGTLGEVYAFDGDYLYGRLHKITTGWRAAEEHYSVMLGGGVHMVDLMMWLTGQKPRRVTAVGNRISTAETAFCFNDFQSATYEFPSGLAGRITANFGSVHRHHHVIRVFGTRATFIYDDRGARLHSSRDPNAEAEPITFEPLPASKGVLIPAFVTDIVGGRPPATGFDRECGVIAACAAADLAMSDGEPKEITYV